MFGFVVTVDAFAESRGSRRVHMVGPGALPDRMWMSIFHPLGRTPVGPIGGLTRETIRFYLNTCLNTSHGATPKTEYRGGDDDSFFIPPSV
ncbi:hypothetical protein MTP99_010004 [Tenebrio molitor]|nr:hypothetical protein MTP99_010004 [Tenebrio molitor]